MHSMDSSAAVAAMFTKSKFEALLHDLSTLAMSVFAHILWGTTAVGP